MTKLNHGLVMDAQESDAVVGLFLQFKKKGDKPEWNDISAQWAYRAQWESLMFDKDGLMCRELVGSGKSG